MTAAIAFVASYIVSAAWQVPVLCLAGWLCSAMLRRLEPAAQHRLWMAVLVLCVLVPALPAPRIHGSEVGVDLTGGKAHRATVVTEGSSNAWAVPLFVPMWLMDAAAGIWVMTMAYGSLRLLNAYRLTTRLVTSADPLEEPSAVHTAVERCRGVMTLPQIRVMVSDGIAGPATLRHGGLNVLLLPSRMAAEVAEQDVDSAVAHECAHIARHDFSTHLLLHVLALPVRFHPVLEHVHRQIAATREMACDAAAASLQGPTYRESLLRLAQWIADASTAGPALAMGFAVGIFDSNSLEDRMKRLTISSARTGRAVRLVLSTLAVLAIAATASGLTLKGMHLMPASGDAKAGVAPAAGVAAAAKTVMPVLVYQVDPEYPFSERGHGAADRICVVGLTVDTNGVPQKVHVERTGGKAFDQNAVAAVSQYRFKAGTRNGRVVATDLHIEVHFQMF